MTKAKPFTRHIVSINDLADEEIKTIFDVAQGYLRELADPKVPYRISRSRNLASKYILASLFYEPSTRTRLSFETAMLRLGGANITSADPAVSSAAKGESLADTIRVISNYADIVVIRHPRDGAARLAAEYSQVPIINGGDGSHEHPTQTLCDVFTLQTKRQSLRKLNVAIAGDLKGSRTIHSFVYALARMGAHIVPMPAPGMELPAHVDQRLREEFHCTLRPGSESIGAVYRTPDDSHQPALFSPPDFEVRVTTSGRRGDEKIAAVYVTRFQKERWEGQERPYLKIDSEFLKERKYAHANVLHPLPRVGEIDVALDDDARAVYFEQAAYGVPLRMALIGLLLELNGESLKKFEGGFRPSELPLYEQPLHVGLKCPNGNCITTEEIEQPYLGNKFYVVRRGGSVRLRCMYCETDIEHFVVAHKKNRWFSSESSLLTDTKHHDLKELVVFESEAHAVAAGYHARRSGNGNIRHRNKPAAE